MASPGIEESASKSFHQWRHRARFFSPSVTRLTVGLTAEMKNSFDDKTLLFTQLVTRQMVCVILQATKLLPAM
jgi:hypothetical protein